MTAQKKTNLPSPAGDAKWEKKGDRKKEEEERNVKRKEGRPE